MRDYTGNIVEPEPIGEHLELDGHVLHIAQDGDGSHEVWLNTEVADFDGIHIGGGPTRDAAVANAVATLEAAIEKLQEPPQ